MDEMVNGSVSKARLKRLIELDAGENLKMPLKFQLIDQLIIKR